MCTVCVWPLKQFFSVVRLCLITDFYILGTAAKHIKTILSLADLFSVPNPAPHRLYLYPIHVTDTFLVCVCLSAECARKIITIINYIRHEMLTFQTTLTSL